MQINIPFSVSLPLGPRGHNQWHSQCSNWNWSSHLWTSIDIHGNSKLEWNCFVIYDNALVVFCSDQEETFVQLSFNFRSSLMAYFLKAAKASQLSGTVAEKRKREVRAVVPAKHTAVIAGQWQQHINKNLSKNGSEKRILTWNWTRSLE